MGLEREMMPLQERKGEDLGRGGWVRKEGHSLSHLLYTCLLCHSPLHMKLQVTVSYSRDHEWDYLFHVECNIKSEPRGQN